MAFPHIRAEELKKELVVKWCTEQAYLNFALSDNTDIHVTHSTDRYTVKVEKPFHVSKSQTF